MVDDSNIEVIDDLVVLGRAGPELIEDEGRHTVCLGGWSDSKGYVRLYPTHKYSNANRWNVIKVPALQDAEHDYRDESWKIEGSKKDWSNLYKKIEKVDELGRGEQIELVQRLPKVCRNTINDRHQSLGLVEPKEIHDAYLEPIENPDPIFTDLQGNQFKSKGSYPQKLYIEYTCKGCEAKGRHRQHCIEWGIFRFWDNYPDRDPEEVIDALRLFDDDYKKYFFIGNMHNHPTSYIIISVLRWKKDKAEQGRLGAF